MKKLLLGLVALVGAMTASAAETVLWEGSQKLSWGAAPTIQASACQSFEEGGDIVVSITCDASGSYTSMKLMKPDWGTFSWGDAKGYPRSQTSVTYGPMTADDVTYMKSNGFTFAGNEITVTKVVYRSPSGPVDPTVLLRDPVSLDVESGSVEFTYDAIVAAGGEVGGGVRVDYAGMAGKNFYVNFLHQGDAENQYTWCDFSAPVVTEKDGYSILHLTETTMDEINSFSKTLVVQGGYVNISCVKVVLPADMPDAPQPDPQVTLDKTELTLEVEGEATLTATVVPAGAALTWTSSDPSVATVDANGKVKAIAAGTATIKAATADAFAECAVTVKEKSAYTIKATLENGRPVESLELWLGDMSTPRLLFVTEPADAMVSVELKDANPDKCVKLYNYKPSSHYNCYNTSVAAEKAGTATVVAYLTANPDVKVEIPVTVRDYDNPTLKIEPWGNPIDPEAVAPGQEPYEIYAGIKLPGGDIDWDVLMDESYTYAYTSSNPEVATVEAGGDYPSVAKVIFTGTPGTVTISVVMTPPAGSSYPSMEASLDFTVLNYGEVKYIFDYYYGDWKANYGFPDTETITDFTAVGKKVDMFFSNAVCSSGSAPVPQEGSYFEFKVTDPNVRILHLGGSPTPSTPAQIKFADKVTVDNGSVDGSSWKPDEADAAVGVESVRFTCTANVTSLCFWHVTLMYYAPAEVAISKAEASVKEGETLQLTADVSGEHILPGGTTLWSSSDESVATVDADGLVTAVAAGEAVITADYAGSKAVCTVTVEKQDGILGIEADNAEPVEFYNLQGIRVSNPEAGGIYIRRQGNNVTKVLVK